MGLLQNILGQKMQLSWVDDGKGGREIKPGWYLALEFNYKNPPRNHIRICLHQDAEGQILCTGDKNPVKYPPEYFRGIACGIGGKRLFVIDPRYTLLKEREGIKAGMTKHPERHREAIHRLETWLAQPAEEAEDYQRASPSLVRLRPSFNRPRT
jgi:hypothetical protein